MSSYSLITSSFFAEMTFAYITFTHITLTHISILISSLTPPIFTSIFIYLNFYSYLLSSLIPSISPSLLPSVIPLLIPPLLFLTGNWDNEIRRWVGDGCPTFAVKSTDPKKTIRNFVQVILKCFIGCVRCEGVMSMGVWV